MITEQTIGFDKTAPVGAARPGQPSETVPARKRKVRVRAANRTHTETEPAVSSGAAKAGRSGRPSGPNTTPASISGSDRQAKVAAATTLAGGQKKSASVATKADRTSKFNNTDATQVGKAEPRTSRSRNGGGTAKDGSKTESVLKKLHLAKGVSIEQLVEATGWQTHSVRSFLSAVVRKKMRLDLISQTGKDGVRRYRVANGAVS